MKQSAAQAKATANWEKRNYFKVLVRFKKEDEDAIRAAAGDSLNGFIVNAVLTAAGAAGDAETHNAVKDTPERENAQERPQESAQVKWYAFPADMIEEMQKYGDPVKMLFDGAMAMLSEYRAGIRS